MQLARRVHHSPALWRSFIQKFYVRLFQLTPYQRYEFGCDIRYSHRSLQRFRDDTTMTWPHRHLNILIITLTPLHLLACSVLDPPLYKYKDMGDMSDMNQGEEMSMYRGEHGDACTSQQECNDGLSCASTQQGFYCMKHCDTPGLRCEGTGEVCTALASDEGNTSICYLGGTTPVGAPCDNNVECASGSLCFGSSEASYCLEACHTSALTCTRTGDLCTIPENQQRGYCQPEVGSSCQESEECTSDAQLDCSQDHPEEYDVLQRIFVASACTTTTCTPEESCAGGQGYCAVVPGATVSKLPVCIRTCQKDSDCRFQVEERCWSKQECEGREDAAMCAQLLEQSGLCLHKDMSFFF